MSQSNLDKNVVYELIQGHGRTDMYLHYATVVGDFERVIAHWILEEQWTKAIDALNRQVSIILVYRNVTDQLRKDKLRVILPLRYCADQASTQGDD